MSRDLGSWLLFSTTHVRAVDGAYYRCFAAHIELDPTLVKSTGADLEDDNAMLARMAVLTNVFGLCLDIYRKPVAEPDCRKMDQSLPWIPAGHPFVVESGRVVVDMTTRYALRINHPLWMSAAEATAIGDLRSYRLVITADRYDAP